MGRTFTVHSAGGTVALDGSQGIRARLQVRGTGAAPVQNQWFEGAGNGASFRGGRVLPRTLDLPVKVFAPPNDWANRSIVRTRFALLQKIFSLQNAPARLTLDLDTSLAGGDKWYTDVVRTGGGDWDWSEDTDGKSFIHTVYSLQAGDPYWTAVNQEGKEVSPAGVGIGLLGSGVSLAQLRVGSEDGFGETTITNSGEVEAWPTWTIFAPFSGFALTSQYGETLVWTKERLTGVPGDEKTSGYVTVNTKTGEVQDETGANMYGGLDDAPQFWSVREGSTTAEILMSDADVATRATVTWNPRREILF